MNVTEQEKRELEPWLLVPADEANDLDYATAAARRVTYASDGTVTLAWTNHDKTLVEMYIPAERWVAMSPDERSTAIQRTYEAGMRKLHELRAAQLPSTPSD